MTNVRKGGYKGVICLESNPIRSLNGGIRSNMQYNVCIKRSSEIEAKLIECELNWRIIKRTQ
jgi:hypothetical protein